MNDEDTYLFWTEMFLAATLHGTTTDMFNAQEEVLKALEAYLPNPWTSMLMASKEIK